jgi:hypothetical protein
LRAITLNSSYELHQEDETGSIEAGKLADLIVLDRNFFTIPAEQIADIKVVKTIVGGRTVYDAESPREIERCHDALSHRPSDRRRAPTAGPASDWWIGKIMTTQAEQWTRYWTNGKGHLATTAMEDCGVLQSLTFLAQAKKVRLDRVLVLRTGANYTLPPMGETAAQLLAQEANEDDVLSAYVPSLEAAYRVGSPVVNEVVTHWEKYRDQTPTTVP